MKIYKVIFEIEVEESVSKENLLQQFNYFLTAGNGFWVDTDKIKLKLLKRVKESDLE